MEMSLVIFRFVIQESKIAFDDITSFDFAVGISIYDSGFPIGFTLKVDERSFSGKENIVSDGDSFSCQDGRHFIENTFEGESGILVDFS